MVFYSIFGVFGYNYYLNLSKEMPENHFGYISYLSNAAYSTHNFIMQTKSYLIEPPSTSMLPDSSLPRSIEIPYFKSNYTLLVKLEDLLINRNI